jgi:hypothetical protein
MSKSTTNLLYLNKNPPLPNFSTLLCSHVTLYFHALFRHDQLRVQPASLSTIRSTGRDQLTSSPSIPCTGPHASHIALLCSIRKSATICLFGLLVVLSAAVTYALMATSPQVLHYDVLPPRHFHPQSLPRRIRKKLLHELSRRHHHV